MILAKAMSTIRNLKKTYRYSLGITIFTMAFSAAIMLQNGQASQRMDPPLFLSLMALFNMYIHIIAFFYAPSIGEIENSDNIKFDITSAEKERR